MFSVRTNSVVQAALALAVAVRAYDNGLALTPQMGWNTWNYYGCDISEDLIVNSAKALAANLSHYGYEYVLMDDCWHADARDPTTGAPVANPERFPSGIKAVADQVHALGLKFGIYSSAGVYTCAGRFGSLGYEEIDAKTYAEWDIDYVKYDNCYNEGRAGTPLISFERYANMSRALNATGRPMVYSMCNWGEDGPWNFAPTIAHSWRISGDIIDIYAGYDDRCPCTSMIDCKLAGYHCSMSRIIDFVAPMTQKAGVAKWNDLDLLEVGNGGMTYDEYVTHFSMWAILKSPLILSTDIGNLSNETLSIITNRAIIAISQDPSGSSGIRLWKKPIDGGDLQLWYVSLSNNTFVVALMNTSPDQQTVDVSFSDVFIDQGSSYQSGTYAVYDLWQKNDDGDYGKNLGTMTGSIAGVALDKHQTKVWKLVPAASCRTSMYPYLDCNPNPKGPSALFMLNEEGALSEVAEK